ncbi:MAG: histidine phosphatase family protein [Lachnospiraceae bacterium]|nr:histidine phosphatase family protein [Lachnospiraceae bacterium]
MPGKLYVIRHGKTDWNEQCKLQGRTDIPLNETGKAQAHEAAAQYGDVHFDICYCSPLMRAKETMEILLEGRDIPVIFDDRLREMNFGTSEGVYDYFEDESLPVNVFFKHPEEYHTAPPEGESIDDLMARTGAFLEEVALPLVKEGKDVLIVGHGALDSSIVCHIKNRPLADFWKEGIGNCKLIQLI